MVHGEQGVILHKPLPTQATISSTSKISNIYDKEKAALVILETTALDTSDGNDDNTFIGAGAGINATDVDQSTLIGYSGK